MIQAGITPPDDGSSAMSASDFRVFSPTKACVESQLSMTPPSSTISPVRRPNYLYGRPLNVQQQQPQIPINIISGADTTTGSGMTNNNNSSSTIMKTTNLPLPILSDLETTTEADSEDSNIPPPAFPQLPHPHLQQQQRHHAHYGHHSHFHHPTKVACQSNTGCAGGNHIPATGPATVTTHSKSKSQKKLSLGKSLPKTLVRCYQGVWPW